MRQGLSPPPTQASTHSVGFVLDVRYRTACFIAWCYGSDVAHRRPGLCEIDCHDVKELKLWSSADVRQTVALIAAAKDRVAAGTTSATDCGNLELVLGLNYNAAGILASDALSARIDPVAACTYDWVHNMLQDGVLSMEISAFLIATDVPRINVFNFLKEDGWVFPKGRRSKFCEIHKNLP